MKGSRLPQLTPRSPCKARDAYDIIRKNEQDIVMCSCTQEAVENGKCSCLDRNNETSDYYKHIITPRAKQSSTGPAIGAVLTIAIIIIAIIYIVKSKSKTHDYKKQ